MKFKDAVTYAVKNFSSVTFINRIKEEDFKHLNILKEINKMGYITKESQAGNHNQYI